MISGEWKIGFSIKKAAQMSGFFYGKKKT